MAVFTQKVLFFQQIIKNIVQIYNRIQIIFRCIEK
jgi:hypothetical protein